MRALARDKLVAPPPSSAGGGGVVVATVTAVTTASTATATHGGVRLVTGEAATTELALASRLAAGARHKLG